MQIGLKNTLLSYILIVVGVTSVFSIVGYHLRELDKTYFREHKAELTTIHRKYDLKDREIGKSYEYTKTPYHKPTQVIGLFHLIVSLLLTWFLSAKFLLKNVTKKQYRKSLYIPLSYGLVILAKFFLTMDPSYGWEYQLGMIFTLIFIGFVLFVSVVVNGIILKVKGRKNI